MPASRRPCVAWSAAPTSLSAPDAVSRGGLRHAFASPSLVLFLAFVASQAGVLVLSPILSDVADDFGVSIAAAGQLRILAAPLAVVAALVAGRLLTRYSPRALLGVASVLLAVGSLASAAAPSFTLLALAQIPMWIGISTILAAGIAAMATWTEPEQRTRVVAHAFAGPPTAWIVGMPIIGLVAEVHWRLAFLALPLPAALLAGLAVLGRPHDSPIPRAETSLRRFLGRADGRRWALGEQFANAAWSGTLVFSGALLTEHYGMSTTATGVALAAVAVAYLLGNRRAGGLASERARRTMLACSLAAAVAVALTWSVTPAVAVTLVLFAASGALVADANRVGHRLRVQRRGRARSRGRHRPRRHDAARVPHRRARRRRCHRDRRLRAPGSRDGRAPSRLDAALRRPDRQSREDGRAVCRRFGRIDADAGSRARARPGPHGPAAAERGR